jgi:hypothetical protein
MNKLLVFILLFSTLGLSAVAQQPEKKSREEKDEQSQARLSRIRNKNDITLFRKQLLALKEYADERKKIPDLQKSSKSMVKVSIAIDTADLGDDTTAKTLTGYIKQDIGDASNNVYEIIFDRTQKKIVSIKRTGEGEEAEKEPNDDGEKATPKKTDKKTVHKKNKDDDDDDDPDDDAPSKKKDKDDD